jgi:hypothetical protein
MMASMGPVEHLVIGLPGNRFKGETEFAAQKARSLGAAG